ncbi:MAG: hypothetical protein HN929_11940 [Chloroflexi bacterium]|jgi:hypothetical protein|nr:hypothetical protein [Chloroflexota bacterium]MBT7082150.1 hypothetical protein [Chloroflexota bacterium]MBT7290791.1 hypothetical protein [Chloroflexota bacterium]
MFKIKKFWIGAIAALALAVSGIGVAFANDTGETLTDTEVVDQRAEMLARVTEIYETNTGTAIDAEALQAAFDEAQQEKQDEMTTNLLTELVADGTITQEEADQLLEWWGARPDTMVEGLLGGPMGGGQGQGGHGERGGPGGPMGGGRGGHMGGPMGGGNFPFPGEDWGDGSDEDVVILD